MPGSVWKLSKAIQDLPPLLCGLACFPSWCLMVVRQASQPKRQEGRNGGQSTFSSCTSLIREENLSEFPEDCLWSWPKRSTGQFCLEEDWTSYSVKTTTVPAMTRASHQRHPTNPGVYSKGQAERALSLVTQIQRCYWRLVGCSRNAKCPKMHRTLFAHTKKVHPTQNTKTNTTPVGDIGLDQPLFIPWAEDTMTHIQGGDHQQKSVAPAVCAMVPWWKLEGGQQCLVMLAHGILCRKGFYLH